ncbi:MULTISPECIES: hypothetical protein [unclassified Acinetobacter]|uniref:hypothetical protein n=1 Tax=unclassified Acinetobacter TaxID=196816 RepID=UPI00190C551D|nr:MULTISPECIES: hypothetical protein [unclassified Acinetobacter]MBK0062633.1 ribbon-helix-helix protein, CopG family [Acinetobacter sp. S55]MBK0065790.1 ribbon-helix-helix protein, CopG family [Acinetobacter sp. S54]
MAKSTTQIQAESDNKRGIKAKTYKLPITTVELIDELSKEHGIPQNQLITQAIALLDEKFKRDYIKL